MLLCVPKIRRKLLLGKKPTPVVKIMSQEDGKKILKSKFWWHRHDIQGVPFQFLFLFDLNVESLRLYSYTPTLHILEFFLFISTLKAKIKVKKDKDWILEARIPMGHP